MWQNFIRSIVMSDTEFENWDDFVDAIDGLVNKGLAEKYTNEDGEECLKLTEQGQEAAELYKIKEMAKDMQGLKKYRKSENARAIRYRNRLG